MDTDIPFGVIEVGGKLKYIDSIIMLGEAKRRLKIDYSGNEGNLNHAIMAILLFGEDLILTIPFRTLYVVRGRYCNTDIKVWCEFKEMCSCKIKKDATKLALYNLQSRFKAPDTAKVIEHIGDKAAAGLIKSIKLFKTEL